MIPFLRQKRAGKQTVQPRSSFNFTGLRTFASRKRLAPPDFFPVLNEITLSCALFSTQTVDRLIVSPPLCGSNPYPCGSLTYRNCKPAPGLGTAKRQLPREPFCTVPCGRRFGLFFCQCPERLELTPAQTPCQAKFFCLRGRRGYLIICGMRSVRNILGCRQAVRHRTLTPAFASPNLASPALENPVIPIRISIRSKLRLKRETPSGVSRRSFITVSIADWYQAI